MEQPGKVIGRYIIHSPLGAGATSDVYLAYDSTSNNRLIALKLLRPSFNYDRNTVERFWREAHGTTGMEHAHIVPIHERGVADGYYFIAMRYIDGGSVEGLLEQAGRLPLEVTCRIVSQIASALDFAHARGVIHRDIKPSNILLSGGHSTAYLTDFGIARVLGRQTITDHGVLIGTPAYMSPEQIRGEAIDHRSDIYSLGVTVYQMLFGKLPFEGEPASILYNHVHTKVQRVSTAATRIPAAVQRVILQALDKNPAKRFQSASHFAAALARAANVPVSQTNPPGPRPVPAPFHIRWPLLAALLIPVALLLWYSFSGNTPSPAGATPTVTTWNRQPGTTATLAPGSAAPETVNAATPTVTLVAGVPLDPATAAPSTPTVTAAPSARAATGQPARPMHIFPPQNLTLPASQPRQTFRWSWREALPPDHSFQLRFYRPGDVQNWVTPFPLLRATEQEVDLSRLSGPGPFEWSIAVVSNSDASRPVTESYRWTLLWNTP